MMALVALLLSSAPEVVTFEQAVERAQSQAPRLAVVRAAVQRAEALVVQSRAAWLPTLTLNATATQLEGNRGLADRVLVPAQSANGSLQLAFPLLAVPRWLATGDAERGVEVARLDVAEAERAVVSLVARAWLTVALQRALVGVAQRAKEIGAQQVSLAELRASGGLGTRLDLARARREAADATARLARAEAELVVAREVLGALLGAEGPLDVTGTPALEGPGAVDVEAALGRRPDVRAAEERVALATRVLDRSWTDYVPTVGLLVQPTAQAPPTPTQPAIGLSAQVSVQAPLFDGLARSGLSQEREAQRRAALAQAVEVRLRARSELRQALAVLELRRAAAVASAEVAKYALEAEQLAQIAWREGASTNVELIEAERAARDAESLAEVSRTNELAARVDWWVASGRPELTPTSRP